MNKWQLRREAGQALVLVALAMPLFMSIAALVVNGTNLMVHRRQLQGGRGRRRARRGTGSLGIPAHFADGRAMLNVGDARTVQPRPAIVAAAEDYSNRNNGPGTLDGGSCSSDTARCRVASDTNCYAWPYNGNSKLVEVRLRETVSGFFTNAVDADRSRRSTRECVQCFVAIGRECHATDDCRQLELHKHPDRHDDPAEDDDRLHDDDRTGRRPFSPRTSYAGPDQGISVTGNSDRIAGLAFSNGRITITGNASTHVEIAVYGGPNGPPFNDPRKTGRNSRHSDDPKKLAEVGDRPTVCRCDTGQQHSRRHDAEQPGGRGHCSGTGSTSRV